MGTKEDLGYADLPEYKDLPKDLQLLAGSYLIADATGLPVDSHDFQDLEAKRKQIPSELIVTFNKAVETIITHTLGTKRT